MSASIDKGDNSSTATVMSNVTSKDQLTTMDEIIISLHVIVFILAVVGNGLVIATLVQNRRMRTVTNVFLLNLAVSDLLLAIFCMPFTVIPVVMEDFIFGHFMCVLIRYLQGMSVSASAFTLVAISLERFYAICSPLTSRKWQHLKHSYKVIAVIWATSMIINLPLAFFQTIVTFPSGSRQCSDKWPDLVVQQVYYFLHLAIADLTAPLIIMCIAYSLIAKTLWNGLKTTHIVDTTLGEKTRRQMSLTSDGSDLSEDCDMLPGVKYKKIANKNLTHQINFSPQNSKSCGRQDTVISLRSHVSASNVKSKRRVIRMLFVIVMEFFICWTPLYLVYLWIVLDRESATKHLPSPGILLSMFRLLAYTSSCCNPITYCFMSKKFRAAFLTAFRCSKLHRRSTIQSTQITYCDNNGTNNNHPLLQRQSSRSKRLRSVSSNGSIQIMKLPLEKELSNGKGVAFF
ncbi:hypothetical protein EB796_017205 [Bugula neritina]|uniref:G-protein coupled receptors family 1 profile domain-containing protein n=1 Tax=Bugula neritina TaxID=10212 RepID=A0A7J7JEL1_BUGNE|nr:hypothetical protein EB796_017205 [Bugula neritina]